MSYRRRSITEICRTRSIIRMAPNCVPMRTWNRSCYMDRAGHTAWNLFQRKKVGRLTGWVSYTLSRTEIEVNGINHGDWYPAQQDRTNDLAFVGIYQVSKKWTVSATWVYYTGMPATFPSGKYPVHGQTMFYYTERNGYRCRRTTLDFAATLEGKKHPKSQSSWTFSTI